MRQYFRLLKWEPLSFELPGVNVASPVKEIWLVTVACLGEGKIFEPGSDYLHSIPLNAIKLYFLTGNLRNNPKPSDNFEYKMKKARLRIDIIVEPSFGHA